MHHHNVRLSILAILLAWPALVVPAEPAAPRAAFYCDPSGSWSAAQRESLVGQLEAAGLDVTRCEAADLVDTTALTPATYDLLIVADAGTVPSEAPPAIAGYVRGGGKLMLLGGPFFDRRTYPYGATRLPHAELLRRVAEDVRPTVLLDFDGDFPSCQHYTDRPDLPSACRPVRPGAAGSTAAARLDLAAAAGWDTYQWKLPCTPPGTDPVLTSFWAKADQDESPLVVEWREQDSSRWMAVVKLSPRWKHYVLPPAAFHYWPDARVKGRGGPGDRFRPRQVASIALGIARSHAPVPQAVDRVSFSIDSVGLAPLPPGLAKAGDLLEGGFDLPRIETASPRYKLYPVGNLARLRGNPQQRIVETLAVPTPAAVYSPYARPRATGLDKQRPWRFIALLECLDAEGRVCGTAASLLLTAGQGGGGMVAAVPVADPSFFARPDVARWLARLAVRMADGVFLAEGGAEYYASFGDESIPVGALVANRGRRPAAVRVDVAIGQQGSGDLWRRSFQLDLAPGRSQRVADDWTIAADAKGPFTVEVTLHRDDKVIDRLTHQVRVWRPPAHPEFVTAAKGDLWLGGRRWGVHGVNYMPSSGAAMEDQAFFEYWLDARAYGPEIIERDLADLQAIGLNAVSAFVYHRSLASRNLLDFLMRCRDHGLKVNLSLRPGTPLDFHWDQMREIVASHRLAENDTVMAYDLAWEPMWGRRDRRRRYDPLWRLWVRHRYGDLAAAEKAWHFKAPTEQGKLAGPDDRQVSSDGPWRRMAIDYRRFLNELLNLQYGRARTRMRSVDPNHLVGFRMTIAGDPTVNQARMAYDLAGLARAVDLMEPEGYGRIGDWQRVRPGMFTVAYARAVAPELPVVWAEFGQSAWDPAAGKASQARLAAVGRFYDDFYKMAHQAGSNGTIAWFSCGGYRVNEKSDYGIANPDRSWRPATEVIHRWAAVMKEPPQRLPPDVWIPIQLDRHTDGIAGIYRHAREAFWSAVDQGRRPGLKVAPAE